MDILEKLTNHVDSLPKNLQKVVRSSINSRSFNSLLKRIPYVRERMDGEYSKIVEQISKAMPQAYKDDYKTHLSLPAKGYDHKEILNTMKEIGEKEKPTWSDGFVSGAVYHGEKEHIDFLNEVYSLNSQSNPIHTDVWPSIRKYEAEIISMVANMMGAEKTNEDICGTVTSGGTESIILAMKVYRDRLLDKKAVSSPEMIVPETAHAAFDKASNLLGIKKVTIKMGDNYLCDPKEVEKHVNRRTAVIVGSAPNFPHGLIDPIPELARIAMKNDIGFHTDACLGGFVLPWLPKECLSPEYDFQVPGVTSISVDTHKYGFASKGSSVVLYRDFDLRRYQYYVTSEWPGGLYFSPTLAGSRSGAIIAQCWASMIKIGKNGYYEATKKIIETASYIKTEIDKIDSLSIIGNPLWVIAFKSNKFDVYDLMDQMTKKGWHLNGLHKPACLHLCVTLKHTQPGVAERFVRDLKSSVLKVASGSKNKEGLAPVYGMGQSFPMRGAVDQILKLFLDNQFKP